MDKSLSSLDWSLVQTILTVAETGSLSEAARQLGLSQPTVGRQIQKAEEVLDVTLFHRQARGFAITPCGASLLPHARTMAEAMRALHLSAAGHSHRLSGPVRITASVFTAHHHLPPIIARIREAEPDISIDLVPSDASENLLYREADIAVRMYRTEQLDIVTKHLGDLSLGVYAAQSYVQRRGRPTSMAELLQHDLVGFDRSDRLLRGLREFGVDAQRDWFATRTDDHGVYLELIRAGCGIGFAQNNVAQRFSDLEQLLPDLPVPGLPLWLAAHEAVRTTPRIRRVWDLLEEGLMPFVS
ncbi:LysR family transcriptional regulator [Tropicibacter naphthalenivorans]|uniref:CysJI operon transcriptional activator n=1 Tax=Tropicibacter naphthalenivorans TaxID=441103 RepID=A0A0P1GEL9_9RHOB|nr:LysR family transcriptional regulator [Tropicibacter naphthalenivorans]CUH79811.1 CysJI operon transcriptional activator [Tropicibacter naphthalenivorans]SMC75320.1 transcriptional regulator, LysR family [Tropicibacter naphthalenivorans]